ncbi:MAG TPA: PAS domain-containing sensor histidine kinase [Gemmatimonadaceae bacterium]|nr:PAS domain-containing sensor histidine kinase [Gemmatimonadaceae bacterium]
MTTSTVSQPRPERGETIGALADLLAHAPAGFLEFRDDGVITFANTTLGDMLGTTEALGGRSLDTILTKASQIFYQTHFFPLLKLKGSAKEIYLSLRAATGHTVHVLANATRRDTPNGPRNTCVFMPIDERQKYEVELLRSKQDAESASAAKTRFLSVMSHDLRTPLGAISGYVDLLTLGLRGELNQEQLRDLARIKGLSQSLLTMVEDILHFARSDPQKLPVQVRPLAVETVLQDVETTILPQVNEAGLLYRRAESQPELKVNADQARLQRILMNLLSNAIKFTPRGGEVTLGARSMGSVVALQVSDTGRGIPPERIDDIFRPFVQVESGDQKLGGVGLGLAISREFARAMGGDIGAESTPGKGSVFTVTLNTA